MQIFHWLDQQLSRIGKSTAAPGAAIAIPEGATHLVVSDQEELPATPAPIPAESPAPVAEPAPAPEVEAEVGTPAAASDASPAGS